jgi:hypothetical protein
MAQPAALPRRAARDALMQYKEGCFVSALLLPKRHRFTVDDIPLQHTSTVYCT